MTGRPNEQAVEWLACAESPIYFIDRYVQIYDATERKWIPFKLWKEQARTLIEMKDNRLVAILKARQLGITWLVLGFALWLMIFHPAVTVLIFSRRDTEAVYLLGEERLRGMYSRLPEWMQARQVLIESAHEWQLSNGSIARAFPTSAGDSYTATLAIVDEADLAPDLARLMNAVKPTIDGGGRMVMLSRSDNTRPDSMFKKIYKAAKAGTNGWKAVFLPWWVRPARDVAWYEAQKADILARSGGLDDLHQQYPNSDVEALSARSLDKRIPSNWLNQCYAEIKPLSPANAPAIPNLVIWATPRVGREYVIGADPAEGNPTSDNSSMTVVDTISGEEVAQLTGRYEPSTFGSYISQVSRYYNKAAALPERNNHGHAVILWLRDNSKVKILRGQDHKPGWQTTSVSKALMYEKTADAFRNQETSIHSFDTLNELSSIEGSSLSAPEGLNDDRATSYALALLARTRPKTYRMPVA
jgi:hypothetical protein